MSYAPIVRPDPTSMTAAFGALAGAILRERPVWDQVDLRGLVEEEYSTKELARAFRLGGMVVDTYFQFENWYQSVAGLSGAAYFDSRPSQLRNTIRRKSKKVSRDHRLDFRLYRTAEDLEKGQEDYEAVYAQSWKDPEMYPAFVRQLLQQSAEEGRLRLGIIYVDGLPSAAQIWLVTGNRATIYKLAYDERHVQLSVGSILTKMMFDHIIDDDHVEEVDYGVGGEAYKRDWMSHRRMIVGLIGFNSRSARGLIAMVRHFAGRKLVRLSRSIGSFLSVRHLRLPLGQSVSKNPNNSVREGRDRGRQ